MTFHFLRDPGADGVGVAFTSEAIDLGDAQAPEARAQAFAALAGSLGATVVVAAQVHGTDVVEVTRPPAEPGASAGQADALITALPDVALAMRVADCVPVLFASASTPWIGAVHAGRRGIELGVVPATIAALRARGAQDLQAWIGPHVCERCYEVPPSMAAAYAEVTGVEPTCTTWGTTSLDLGAAVRMQLDAAGVTWESHEACTMHDPGLHSYRRAAAASGRLAGLVWRRGPQGCGRGAVG